MSSNPENQKLQTLALATMVRSDAKSAAALRDLTGRTYVAIPVEIGDLKVDAVRAVLVVAKASGISGIEAIVVTGEKPIESSIALVKTVTSAAQVFFASASGELLSL